MPKPLPLDSRYPGPVYIEELDERIQEAERLMEALSGSPPVSSVTITAPRYLIRGLRGRLLVLRDQFYWRRFTTEEPPNKDGTPIEVGWEKRGVVSMLAHYECALGGPDQLGYLDYANGTFIAFDDDGMPTHWRPARYCRPGEL